MSERKLLDAITGVREVKSSADAQRATRQILKKTGLALPLPGQGQTLLRWKMLMELGAFDLCVAKLAESHYDALAMLHEAGKVPKAGIYGVWASKFGGRFLEGRFDKNSKKWIIAGEIAFASGVGLVDQALIPVMTSEGEYLFEVPSSAFAITKSAEDFWQTPGMKNCETAWIEVAVELSSDDLVGGQNFYLQRPGFWMGGIGVAACWLGAAQNLFEIWQQKAVSMNREDPFEAAARCEIFVDLKAGAQLFAQAAKIIDDKTSTVDQIRTEAYVLRHYADRVANQLLERANRAMGPILMVGDSRYSRKALDLQIFTRQCHAEKDLIQISSALKTRFPRSGEKESCSREVWFE